jgi:hypothetical protein
MSGIPATLTTAEALVPVRLMGPVARGAAVVLVTVPLDDDATFMVTWQLAPGARDAAEKRTPLLPAAICPPEALVTLPQPAGVKVVLVSRSVIPAGKVSVTLTPVSAAVLAAGLVRTSVRLTGAPGATFGEPKVFVVAGGAKTLSVALVLLVSSPPPWALNLVLLFKYEAAASPRTVALKLQAEVPAVMVPDERATVEAV